jgi:hypothetical protein
MEIRNLTPPVAHSYRCINEFLCRDDGCRCRANAPQEKLTRRSSEYNPFVSKQIGHHHVRVAFVRSMSGERRRNPVGCASLGGPAAYQIAIAAAPCPHWGGVPQICRPNFSGGQSAQIKRPGGLHGLHKMLHNTRCHPREHTVRLAWPIGIEDGKQLV